MNEVKPQTRLSCVCYREAEKVTTAMKGTE